MDVSLTSPLPACARLISLNFSMASGLSGFLSGWYFKANYD